MVAISPPVSTYTINGNTYTNSDWQSNPQGALSGTANDIATIISIFASFGAINFVTFTSSGTVSVPVAGIYFIKKTVGAATSVVLASAINGIIVIKDAKRDADQNPITITVSGGALIDGQSSSSIEFPGGTAWYAWDGAQYCQLI